MKCQIINYQTGKTGWERGGGLRKFEKNGVGVGWGLRKSEKRVGSYSLLKC